MKTIIYAVYLPGSETPDYIGSHNEQPPNTPGALKWRYEHARYVGQGAWIDAEGILLAIPRGNKSTPWGRVLLTMSAADRLALRVETIETVDTGQRWRAEAAALRKHTPRYNTLVPASPEAKRLKYNDYQREYQRAYLQRNPDKLDAKRKSDRERLAAKRAQAKAARQQAQNAQPAQAPSTIPADPQPAPNS